MSEPMRITKKAITVEAMRFEDTEESWDALYAWVRDPHNEIHCAWLRLDQGAYEVFDKFHGWVPFVVGDWIIKGVCGEFYPIKHDVIVETYTQFVGDTPTFGEELAELLSKYNLDLRMNAPASFLVEYVGTILSAIEMLNQRRSELSGTVAS